MTLQRPESSGLVLPPKHRISRERSRLVIERADLAAQQDPLPGARSAARRLAFFGDDQDGIPLEVIAVQTETTRLLVIHAMPLRRRYRPDYEEVMKWQR
jgi:hypothetical protein